MRDLSPLDARECNVHCPGSDGEFCGGEREAVTVYSLGGVNGYKGKNYTLFIFVIFDFFVFDWVVCHGALNRTSSTCMTFFGFLFNLYYK